MKVVLLALSSIVLAVLAAGGFIAYDAWDHWSFPARSPILAALPASWDTANIEFQRRVGQRFPIGSPAKDVAEALAKQGFRPFETERGAAGMVIQPAHPGLRIVCNSQASVVWQTNSSGGISEISAAYRPICL
jgi:hypothetical protein